MTTANSFIISYEQNSIYFPFRFSVQYLQNNYYSLSFSSRTVGCIEIWYPLGTYVILWHFFPNSLKSIIFQAPQLSQIFLPVYYEQLPQTLRNYLLNIK